MDTVIRYITLFRTVWISGRYGGGKTALSIWIAIEMIKQQYGNTIVTNTQLSENLFGKPMDTIRKTDVHDVTDAVVILDEAWLELPAGQSNGQVNAWLAYLRKQNQHILLPSVLPLARQVSHFVVEREYNCLPIGLPLWIYRWRLKGGSIDPKKNTMLGRFPFFKPSKVFPYYNHLSRPGEEYYVYRFERPTAD